MAVLFILRVSSPEESWVPGIYFEQLLFTWLHYIIRSFIIAVRYGFCSELRYLMLKSTHQSAVFINKDLLASGWLRFDPVEGLHNELNSCVYRCQVEESFFSLSFIEKLDPEYRMRLTDEDYYKKVTFKSEDRKAELEEYRVRTELKQLMSELGNALEANHTTNAGEIPEEHIYTLTTPKTSAEATESTSVKYNAKLIMREIALCTGSKQMNIAIVFLLSIIRITIPYLVRWAEEGAAFQDFTSTSWLYSGLELPSVWLLVAVNYLFVFAGLIDFQRRKQMIQACGMLLDPQKDNHPA
jgi:tetrahydromethanopterin S-methyltransferase subunit F